MYTAQNLCWRLFFSLMALPVLYLSTWNLPNGRNPLSLPSRMSDWAISKPYVMQSKCHLWHGGRRGADDDDDDDDGDGGGACATLREGGYFKDGCACAECIKPRISSFAKRSLKSEMNKILDLKVNQGREV